jgi:hypothetical protein
MSAYIVSDAHINALVTYAAAHDVRFVHARELHHIKGNEEKIASLLYIANVESFNHRYREDGISTGFKFRRDRTQRTAAEILKACAGFEYQACEVDHYEETIGCRIIQAIRSAASRLVVGYEAAPWSIDE